METVALLQKQNSQKSLILSTFTSISHSERWTGRCAEKRLKKYVRVVIAIELVTVGTTIEDS